AARRPTRDTSRVGTGRERGPLGDPRAPHVAAGESRRDRRGTPAPPTPLCEACPARRRLAASPLRRHPPIERCAPGVYLVPRWLCQPRHGSRAWYCPFTLASASDPRHASRVALLNHLDARLYAGDVREPCIRGEERCGKRLGEREVHGVVGG